MRGKDMHTDGRHDFDPLHGHWSVRHRRLRQRLAGCTDWDSFAGTSSMQPLLGGLGNVDDNVIMLPAGEYRAATLRAFDVGRRQWSIWWLDARTPGHIEAPMVGRFEGADGVFYADEDFAGRPIRVRFLWLHTRSATPRWEQAFSTDRGLTWETNWEMDFARDFT
ncbi:MAG: DUF1579 domain-containing protein, partial [Chitinophagaceae bacterium]|nr:DUF1579 domain-containing protein [Rubrivivax sp.]